MIGLKGSGMTIYGCKGYNTYGPWQIIGGMNKKHPTKEEIALAVKFVGDLLL